MLLLTYYSVKRMKMIVPTIVMFGVVPQYFLVWIAWRFISCFLPSWVYQAGDDFYYSLYQRLVLFFFENVTGTKVVLYGNVEEALSKKERVIYLSNHQSTADWVVVHMLAERQGATGHVRYVMKDSLQFVPLYGFYFYQHGCVFVKRKSFNGNKMISALNYLQNRKIPTWLVIFPEGTRYNPESPSVIENSKRYATGKGLIPFNHVLSPKYRGLQLVLENVKDHMDAIYDVTVVYSCTKGGSKGLRTKAPSMFEFVTGCCDTVHIHVNRIDVCCAPKTEPELKNWLHSIFHKKDIVLENYYNSSLSPSKSLPFLKGVKSPANLFHTLGSFAFFVTLSTPFVITSYGRSLYWKTWLYGSIFGYFWLGIHSVC